MLDGQIGGGQPRRGRALRDRAGTAVRDDRVRAEARGHLGGGERREITDPAQAEAVQQIHQLDPLRRGQHRLHRQLRDRHGRKEFRPLPGRDQDAAPGREHRRGQLVGNPDLAFHAHRRHRVHQPLGGRCLGPEEPRRPARRQRQHPRPQHLHPRHGRVHGRHHGLEQPRVPIRILRQHQQIRAPPLRLPLPQPAPDPLRPRHRGTGHHPIVGDHRHRPHGLHPRLGRRRHRGPIRAPHHQHPPRLHHSPALAAPPRTRKFMPRSAFAATGQAWRASRSGSGAAAGSAVEIHSTRPSVGRRARCPERGWAERPRTETSRRTVRSRPQPRPRPE